MDIEDHRIIIRKIKKTLGYILVFLLVGILSYQGEPTCWLGVVNIHARSRDKQRKRNLVKAFLSFNRVSNAISFCLSFSA